MEYTRYACGVTITYRVVQVRLGRLSFDVGSVQFAAAGSSRRRRASFSDEVLTAAVPLAVVASALVVLAVVVAGCWLQRRRSAAAGRHGKLSPTRTEYNVNYVHVSESPSLQSGDSTTMPPARTDTGTTSVHLPHTG